MKKELLISLLCLAVCAVFLFAVSLGLSGIASENAERELVEKMQTILPGSTHFTEESYTGEDANIHAVWSSEAGFVVETCTTGYAGQIRMLIGVDKSGFVTGLQVRELSETFGLGANALTDHRFLAQFLHTSGEAEIGTTVDAISGATVTSRAIARSVNSAVAYVTGADASSGATSWGG